MDEGLYEVMMPKLGESITSATIVKWLKKEGDSVRMDEPLLEVSTDKVNSEIPSPVEGVVETIFAATDSELDVGAKLCTLRTKGHVKVHDEQIHAPIQEIASSENFLSPAVLRLVKDHNISDHELKKIVGSGGGGRLTKQDIENYIVNKKSGSMAPACSKATFSREVASEVERVKMSGMRKAIAENMVKSFYEAPHASLVAEVDMTKIVELIKKERERVLKQYGVKITVTTFIAYAIARAVEHFPLINASLDADTILIKKSVNLGIAVSVDQAVMVPVIKNAHTLTLIDIAGVIQDLALKAKSSHLSPQDVKDGTLTMTNFGMSGILLGTPIIRYPEVAIVGVGALTKRVVVHESNSFGIRDMLYLSLTFDHRVLDGMYGCGFLSDVKKILEHQAFEL
jgi:2-oxoglutarate dehydrogenase E2 component (dihydrolipoamide succinyltransferase)